MLAKKGRFKSSHQTWTKLHIKILECPDLLMNWGRKWSCSFTVSSLLTDSLGRFYSQLWASLSNCEDNSVWKSFSQMALGRLDVHMQKNEVGPYISQLWAPGQNTKTGWLEQWKRIFCSGGRESNIRVPSRSNSGESSSPDLRKAAFSLCPHIVSKEGRERYLSLPLLIKPQSYWSKAPPL